MLMGHVNSIDTVAARLGEVPIHLAAKAGHGTTMKTMQLSSKPRTGSLNHARRGRLSRGDGYDPGFASRTDRNRIQWPTAQELQRVSTTLAKVSRTGMRQEDAGDYFTSGDLAYQLQEILGATAALLKRARRINSQTTPGHPAKEGSQATGEPSQIGGFRH